MAQSLKNTASPDTKKTVIAQVVRIGEEFRIPEGMDLNDAIEVLANKRDDEETKTAYVEEFGVYLWEGCFALAQALDHLYGWFQAMTIPGGFFSPSIPPSVRRIACGPDTSVEVPWGRFCLPHIDKDDGYFQTGSYRNITTGMICFKLIANMKKKHAPHFRKLCAEIRKQLTLSTLYKGRAFTLHFNDVDGYPTAEPEFMQISSIAADALIFSRHVEQALHANLYTPITHTAAVRKAGIPLKRGVLLAGPYGTGKTLISTRVKELAVQNGWTYLVCQKASEFPECVQFARQYQPAVVFCEDIDRVTDGDRDEEMDEILNTIDGVDAKNTEILLVLTTNEIDNIHIGMLRPGRLDAVIAVERPDAEAVARLMRHYGGSRLLATESLEKVGAALAGNTPAVIREVVERAKLTALSLTGDIENLQLTEEALMISANTMRMQLDLLNKPKTTDPNPMEVFANVLADHLVAAAEIALNSSPAVIDMLREPQTALATARQRANGHVAA